jgi:prepilin-type N-terminal cleavage/methylation domain-containing protein
MTSPSRPRRARSAPGFSLVELLVVVAVLGVVAGLSAASLAPLQNHFRGRDAATRVASAATRARAFAWQTGRCHVLTIYNGASAATVGTPGDRLLLERYPTADCQNTPAAGSLQPVEWVLLPERVTVQQVLGTDAPVWRLQGRLKGTQVVDLRVDAGDRQRFIRLALEGAVCTDDEPITGCP